MATSRAGDDLVFNQESAMQTGGRNDKQLQKTGEQARKMTV
ncbi:hypothetical protein [Dickeya poaceiphila]|nr:hypothetical protein [Dickeya poaceiphila]